MANTPRYEHDPGRHCVYCQHVVVGVLIPPVRGYTRSLECEKNRGHAGEENCKRVTRALWKPNHCMGTITDRAYRRTVCT